MDHVIESAGWVSLDEKDLVKVKLRIAEGDFSRQPAGFKVVRPSRVFRRPAVRFELEEAFGQRVGPFHKRRQLRRIRMGTETGRKFLGPSDDFPSVS